MSDLTNALLLLNGSKYRLNELLGQVNAAPVIEVNILDLNPFEEVPRMGEVNPEHAVTFAGLPVTDENAPLPRERIAPAVGIVFFKQHGKMTILINQAQASHQIDSGYQVLKGKIISTPALKKTRVPTPEQLLAHQQATEAAASARSYNDDFANRPRFSDKRPNERYGSRAKF